MECLRGGLLGATKDDFASRYCDRRLVPQNVSSIADGRKRWDNSGVFASFMFVDLLASASVRCRVVFLCKSINL